MQGNRRKVSILLALFSVGSLACGGGGGGGSSKDTGRACNYDWAAVCFSFAPEVDVGDSASDCKKNGGAWVAECPSIPYVASCSVGGGALIEYMYPGAACTNEEVWTQCVTDNKGVPHTGSAVCSAEVPVSFGCDQTAVSAGGPCVDVLGSAPPEVADVLQGTCTHSGGVLRACPTGHTGTCQLVQGNLLALQRYYGATSSAQTACSNSGGTWMVP